MSSIEHHQEQRFKTRIPCSLESSLGESSTGLITNVSQYGLRLSGDLSLVKLFFPNIKRDNWRDPIEIKIHFSVSTTDAVAVPVITHCKPTYSRRIHENWFTIGCRFTEIDELSQTRLSNYIVHFISQHSSELEELAESKNKPR